MSTATKRIKYEEFMKLNKEERKQQSDYFRKNKPTTIPTILVKKSIDLPDLPSCKFLINLNNDILGEINNLRTHIIKTCMGKLNGTQSLFFMHNNKLLNCNIKVGEFMAKNYKDTEGDGWFHILYSKSETFG